MSYYRKARVIPRDLQVQDVFGGYNHNARISPAEFYDMKNLTSDLAPVLSPRAPRSVVASGGNYQGLACKDGLVYVDGPDLLINGKRYNIGLSDVPETCPKQLVSMGAYITVWPDGKYLNTVDTTDMGSISAKFKSTASVTLTPCRLDGTEMLPEYIQSETPADPADRALWIDTSTDPHTIKEYAAATGLWVAIASPYIRINSAGIGKKFAQWDGVELTGLKAAAAAMSPNIKAQVERLEGAAIVYARDDDWIIIVGLVDSKLTFQDQITVAREAPLMDFVVESGNRLWGCRYGLARDGQVVNELYACKLGDFKNWSCYLGVSTDSYRVSLGSDGQFTGAATVGGHPVFFKENCLHKVFGQMPSNFSVQYNACRGVQKGCERSLAIVNEILYYKGQYGICSYDGALPQEMSPQLGNVPYKNAVGASLSNKYYVSMQDLSDDWHLFVYDTAQAMWHHEDDLQAYLMCPCRDDLFCISGDRLIAMRGTTGEPEPELVPWMAETGIIGATEPGNKYLLKLSIRMVLEPGSTFAAYVQYDSTGPWDCIGTAQGVNLRSFVFPMVPQRCDHLRLRLTGTGPAKVFAVTKEMSQGSDY